jgi:hypothetical protein
MQMGETSVLAGSATNEDEEYVLTKIVQVITHKGKELKRSVRGRKQYVNLDAAVDPNKPHPEYGQYIELKARVIALSTKQSVSPAGQTVYWSVVPDSANRAGVVGNSKFGFDSTGGPNTKSVTTDAKGWTPAVKFYFSQYGGDRFEIFASLSQSCGSQDPKAGPFVVMRKLFYELDRMKRPRRGKYSGSTDAMATELERSFVALKRVGKDNAPAHQRIVNNLEVDPWTAALRTGQGAPRYFHLVLLDTIAVDRTPQVRVFKLKGTSKIVLPSKDNLLDVRDWFNDASYTQPATGKSGTLSAADFTLTEKGEPLKSNDAFVITLHSAALGLNMKDEVELTLDFNTWVELSGIQSGPATVVGIRWRERVFDAVERRNSTLNTMVHEPGHSMGLASTTFPDGSACNTTYYKDGHHCHHNADTCVMWETNSQHTRLCARCSDCLRGRNLESLPISGGDPFT